jgi:hypothetical protein
MGHKFSLLLSREITDGESAALKEAGCAEAVFVTDSHPTNPDLTVTKMEFDDTSSPSLAAAIESALEAVNKMPDLSVPGLMVPAQPVEDAAKDPGAESTEEPSAIEPDAGRLDAQEAAAVPAAEPAVHG